MLARLDLRMLVCVGSGGLRVLVRTYGSACPAARAGRRINNPAIGLWSVLLLISSLKIRVAGEDIGCDDRLFATFNHLVVILRS